MKYKLYQVDAFTKKIFGGNPAAVVPLDKWIADDLMQKLAMENNLAETVFFAPSSLKGVDYDIRWFTPLVEINLCGHATLASAFVLFEILNFQGEQIVFNSKSGLLKVKKDTDGGDDHTFKALMDFPSWKPKVLLDPAAPLKDILGGMEIKALYKNRDLLVELNDEASVKHCEPDFALMKKYFDKVIITARGNNVDFVSRFFAPGVGIDEDPVTGSAHAQLIPYWSEKLGKTKLHALQLSKRTGELWCEQVDDRVTMSGNCVFYMKGEFSV